LLNYRRRPAPRSQGCEVRASSVIFDTVKRDKFPNDWDRCDPFCKELPSIQLMEWICLDAGRRNLGVIESRFVAGAVTGPKRVPKRGVRNAPSLKLSGMCQFVLPAMAAPSPFLVSVACKGLSVFVSPLESTFTEIPYKC